MVTLRKPWLKKRARAACTIRWAAGSTDLALFKRFFVLLVDIVLIHSRNYYSIFSFQGQTFIPTTSSIRSIRLVNLMRAPGAAVAR
jgi:hypothetical protein